MNIILLFEKDSHGDGSYKLTDHRASHIRTILKAQQGDKIEIGLLNGLKGTAEITTINDNEIILSNLNLHTEPSYNYNVDIICALPRPQTVKKVLFICGMMAVRNLFFIRANRVEKSYYHSPLLEEQNRNEHMYEGLMQGKNTRLPNVNISDKFKPFFEDYLPSFYKDQNEPPTLLLPHIETDKTMINILGAPIRQRRTVGIESPIPLSREGGNLITFAIGPEGGWVDFELDLMESNGFQRIKLSDHTLRVEHALMACLSQLEII